MTSIRSILISFRATVQYQSIEMSPLSKSAETTDSSGARVLKLFICGGGSDFLVVFGLLSAALTYLLKKHC